MMTLRHKAIIVIGILASSLSLFAQTSDPFSYASNIVPSSQSYELSRYGNVQSHQQSVTIGGATTTILTAMEYDSRVRLLCERTFLNGTTARNAAVSYGYDELGRQSFTLDDGLVQLNQYTLQGWMLRKNVAQNDNMIFWEILRYADPAYSGLPRYNGTLSEVAWNPEGGSPTTTYAFEYDGAGRLKNTARLYGGNVTNAYTERDLTYARNGNILSLKRYGTTSSAPADNFIYTYDGNRLSQLNGSFYVLNKSEFF